MTRPFGTAGGYLRFNDTRLKFLEEALQGRYDAILSVVVSWDEFPEPVRKRLVEQVAGGTGYVCIVPPIKTDGVLSKILPLVPGGPSRKGERRWKREQEHPVTTGIPFADEDWMEDAAPDGPSHAAYFASTKSFCSEISRLQLQYRFVIEEQALRGKYEGEVPLALNEKAGTWRVRISDVTSGKTAEQSFRVAGD